MTLEDCGVCPMLGSGGSSEFRYISLAYASEGDLECFWQQCPEEERAETALAVIS